MPNIQQVTPHQFSLFRITLGSVLFIHIIFMLFNAPDIYHFLLEGKGRFLFPNILLFARDPRWVYVTILVSLFLSINLILGYYRKLSCLLLWYFWSCLSINGNFLNVPGLSWYSWLLLIISTLPKGEPWALDKHDPDWRFPNVIYKGSWIILVIGYFLSSMRFQASSTWFFGALLFHLFLINSKWLGTKNNSRPILFFDGVCGLCNNFVDFLFVEDQHQVFKVAALQGETSKKHLTKEDYENLDSVIVVDDGNKYRKSNAILYTLTTIGGFWKLFIIFKIIPVPIRDFFYMIVVQNRYRVFGKKESCRIPTPDERARFLD